MTSNNILYLDPQNKLRGTIENAFPGRYLENAAEALKIVKENYVDTIFICCPELEPDKLIPALLRKNPMLNIILFINKQDSVSDITWASVDSVITLPIVKVEIERLRHLFKIKSLLRDCDLGGRSDAIKEIGELILRLAPTDVTILIVGESGVGKELVARALHKKSRRSSKILVPVNCGAIPETLIESELFGYERGAFTGAFKRKIGYFERASGGTIFLDEIGELNPSLQVKLLRILESGELYRVGSSEAIKVDVRVIAASNRDLKKAVREGKFRKDLYFRLAGAAIYIPSLRQRKMDIPALIYKFTKEIVEREKTHFGGFGEDAIDTMLNYFWPGNIRELKNLVEKSLLIARQRVIHAEDLNPYFQEHSSFGRTLPVVYDGSAPLRFIVRKLEEISSELSQLREAINALNAGNTQKLKENEEKTIKKALESTAGNKRKAAFILGISPKTLYRKMRKYNIPMDYAH